MPVEKGQPEFIYLFHDGTRIASLLLKSGDKVTVSADTLGNFTVDGSDDSAYLAENEKRCCNYLLKSNSEWTLTKGTALAKGNGSSEVILEYRLPLLNLTKELFERAFEQFIGLVTVWRMYLLELEQGNVPKVFAVFQKN
jgi:hypothetical protein